jgi:TrmH family RNA methyltransferase
VITLRKLAGLAPATRRRKIARVCEEIARSGNAPNTTYLAGIRSLVVDDLELPGRVRRAARLITEENLRTINHLRHELLLALDMAPADWDLIAPAGYPAGRLDGGTEPRPIGVYCDAIRSPFNLGSIIRTAAALNVKLVGLSDECPPLDQRRVLRSAMGAEKHVEIVVGDLDRCVWEGAQVIGLELGGEEISAFRFPPEGLIVIGSEEFGIRASLLKRADARVSIRLPGPKASLNVAVALGIALHEWTVQIADRRRRPQDASGKNT